MLIGYVAPTDPFKDKKEWSGTYYGLCEALKMGGYQVEWIPYNNNMMTNKFLAKVYRLFYGKGSFIHSRLMSRYHINSIDKDLNKYDLIFVPAQVDIVAGLKTSTPIIYYTDGTIPLMVDYYWFDFSNRAIKEAKLIEERALKNASLNIFSSEWAANSAIKDYGIDSNRVDFLPFGANIDDSLINYKVKDYSKKKKLNILFSGVDWVRKGGNIAVDTVKKLNERGINSTLYVCGIRSEDFPTELNNVDYVKNIGFLNKNEESDLQKYLDIWENTDIFILPTRAECSAIVLNEANAYGVPILTTETGGLSNYVINGINGQRLSLRANGKDYANVIENWIKNKKLEELSLGARKLYETNNSWKAWGAKFASVIKDKINE